TGADDAVDPAALAALTDEFPFVEWGILLSPKRVGRPRYPTREWVCRFYDPAARHSMFLSAHFCGAYTHETLAGSEKWLGELPSFFGRVQLSGFEPSELFLSIVANHQHHLPEFILQVRSEEDIQSAASYADEIGECGGAASL